MIYNRNVAVGIVAVAVIVIAILLMVAPNG
jgi:hypothetical protein